MFVICPFDTLIKLLTYLSLVMIFLFQWQPCHKISRK